MFRIFRYYEELDLFRKANSQAKVKVSKPATNRWRENNEPDDEMVAESQEELIPPQTTMTMVGKVKQYSLHFRRVSYTSSTRLSANRLSFYLITLVDKHANLLVLFI